MNAVGIDVSKEKSMVAIMRPFGEVAVSPFEVKHTASDLSKLAKLIHSLDGMTRVVMEYTGNYYIPIALHLHNEGLFISVVNPILVRNYGNNTLRRAKTDKKDAIKLANYALDHWTSLSQYFPGGDTRHLLKTFNRQYNQYIKLRVMQKNNLIALLDQTFPGVNRLFSSPPRKSDGREKWLDFATRFWHCEEVYRLSNGAFTQCYRKWCMRNGYNFSEQKAKEIYASVQGHTGLMPKTGATKLLIMQALAQLQGITQALTSIQQEMQRLAITLPEYNVVMSMYGVGSTLGPQLIAEIGDIRRFSSKKALVAFAGLDAPPYQSGNINVKSRSISKRGSPALRKTLFQVMDIVLKKSPFDEPVYQFMDKKRSEGKPYLVYMIASANKFLRVYYARVKQHFDALDKQI